MLRPAAVLALLAVLAPPAAAPAAPGGVTCHCFRDREFDPAAPARSDPYLLATAANTLLAAAYGYPKGRVVRERMGGATAEDLWIAVYAGARLGVDPDRLREERVRAPSWRETLRHTGGPLEELDPGFLSALAGGAGDEAVARAAVAATAAGFLGTPRTELAALSSRGATLQEMALASLLARWSGRPAPPFLAEARSGAVPWSAALERLGLDPTDLERKIPETLGVTLP